MFALNQRAARLCEWFIDQHPVMQIAVVRDESGARFVDCGIHVRGGLRAGLNLARLCLADLADVALVPSHVPESALAVQVTTDHPVVACLGSQYAGWPVSGDRFFAMASGPMRAMRGREPLLEQLHLVEKADQAVGVLEAGRIPPSDVATQIAGQCSVDTECLTLLVAPTASLAGTVQVVARAVETALHKLFELGLDVTSIRSAYGLAPLPPVAANDLAGIGRTNDAILYGGDVTLWIDAPDEELQEYGPRIPSSGSADFGRPFGEIFAQYDHDFYRIDPHLFSPARIRLISTRSGRSFQFGQLRSDVLRLSFGLD